jgi:hypothetical protein
MARRMQKLGGGHEHAARLGPASGKPSSVMGHPHQTDTTCSRSRLRSSMELSQAGYLHDVASRVPGTVVKRSSLLTIAWDVHFPEKEVCALLA